MIKLLVPEQPGESLPLNAFPVFGKTRGREQIKLIGLLDPLSEQAIHVLNRTGRLAAQTHVKNLGLSRRQIEMAPGAGFRAALRRIHGVFAAMDYALVERVL